MKISSVVFSWLYLDVVAQLVSHLISGIMMRRIHLPHPPRFSTRSPLGKSPSQLHHEFLGCSVGLLHPERSVEETACWARLSAGGSVNLIMKKNWLRAEVTGMSCYRLLLPSDKWQGCLIICAQRFWRELDLIKWVHGSCCKISQSADWTMDYELGHFSVLTARVNRLSMF